MGTPTGRLPATSGTGGCASRVSMWPDSRGALMPPILRPGRLLLQSQSGTIGLHMEPINLPERLGRWPAGRGPLHVLLAGRLRRLIDDGELPPGAPLPPDRALAAALAVGRTTVVAAYNLLRAEGRIVRQQGSGTRVAGAAAVAAPDTTSAPI